MTHPVTYGADGGALVHLPRNLIGVRTAQQAHEIADTFRAVAAQLEEFDRAEGARKDRAVGRLVNAAFRTHNVTKPGTVTPTTTVFINACDCGRLQGCETCDPEPAA